jgi:hypothetical protein
MTTEDSVLKRLRELPAARLDDVTAARTLARAEAAFVAAAPGPSRASWWVPAALSLWAALYGWGAVREIGRLFPAARPPAVAGQGCGVGRMNTTGVSPAAPNVIARSSAGVHT